MNKKLFTTAKTVAAIALFAATVATVSAWTAPTATAPGGNVPAPINTGSVWQNKAGDLSSSKSISATTYLLSRDLVTGKKAVLGCLNGSTAHDLACLTNALASVSLLEVGTYNTSGVFQKGLKVDTSGLIAAIGTPIWVNLSSLSGAAGRNALLVLTSSDNTANGDGAVLQTNADRFSLYNVVGQLVGLTAKKIRLTEGAADGKILTSDADGNASWEDLGGTLSTGDGLITYKSTAFRSDHAYVYCGNDAADDANWIAIAGAGYCDAGIRHLEPVFNRNENSSSTLNSVGVTSNKAVGWSIDCLSDVQVGPGKYVSGNGGNPSSTLAQVVCMKNVGLVTGDITSTVTPPPVDTRSWHTVTLGQGNLGQSCASWLGSLYDNDPAHVRITGQHSPDGSTLNGQTQTCVYKYDLPVSGTANGGFAYVDYCVTGTPTTTIQGARPVATCDSPSLGGNININPNTQTPYGWNITKTETYY